MTSPTPASDAEPDAEPNGGALVIDANGYVDVAGMSVPGPLALQIVAAMRTVYPSLTVGLSDVRAVRAVLKYWVTTTVSSFAAQQISVPADAQVAAIQAKAVQAQQVAAAQARAAAESITEAGPATAPAP